MNTYIIGDIHGYSRSLSNLMKELDPNPSSDTVIFLGDLFDRGPDSWGVFQIVQSLADKFGERFFLLRGNHEDYLLAEKLSFRQKLLWERVGRQSTVISFRDHLDKMENAVPWLKENCRKYYKDSVLQCVHAGIKVDPIELNDNYTMIHDHEIVFANRYSGPLTVTGHIALEEPTWFAGDGETIQRITYGEKMDLPDCGVICIDTGCGKGGKLTAMMLSGKNYMLLCVPEEK